MRALVRDVVVVFALARTRRLRQTLAKEFPTTNGRRQGSEEKACRLLGLQGLSLSEKGLQQPRADLGKGLWSDCSAARRVGESAGGEGK